LNEEINWKNPIIQQSQIHSKVKIDLTPFSKEQWDTLIIFIIYI
jgi:hypothetical protein